MCNRSLSPINQTHLIVPCTSRKRSVFGASVGLSDFHDSDYLALATTWFEALDRSSSELTPAKDLYAGEAWSLVKEISKEFDYQWVVSAGYGFISADKKIKPYDATFTARNKNSIPSFGGGTCSERNKAWWSALRCARNDHEKNGQILCIEELLRKHPNDQFLIMGSSSYLKLIKDDIESCINKKLIDKEQLIFIASCKLGSPLDSQLVLFSGHLRNHFGGTMGALNYRIVKWLLSERVGFCVEAYREKIASLKVNVVQKKKPSRPLTDQDVEKTIEMLLSKHGNAAGSYTKALSLFRKEYGLSCEQKKFSKLYKNVRLRKQIKL